MITMNQFFIVLPYSVAAVALIVMVIVLLLNSRLEKRIGRKCSALKRYRTSNDLLCKENTKLQGRVNELVYVRDRQDMDLAASHKHIKFRDEKIEELKGINYFLTTRYVRTNNELSWWRLTLQEMYPVHYNAVRDRIAKQEYKTIPADPDVKLTIAIVHKSKATADSPSKDEPAADENLNAKGAEVAKEPQGQESVKKHVTPEYLNALKAYTAEHLGMPDEQEAETLRYKFDLLWDFVGNCLKAESEPKMKITINGHSHNDEVTAEMNCQEDEEPWIASSGYDPKQGDKPKGMVQD